MAAAKRFVAVFERNRVARRFLGEETSPIESCRSKRKRRRNDEGNRQGVDRRENRRYRSRRGDRGANEGEEREIARRLGSEAADSRLPSADSVVAAAGHRAGQSRPRSPHPGRRRRSPPPAWTRPSSGKRPSEQGDSPPAGKINRPMARHSDACVV